MKPRAEIYRNSSGFIIHSYGETTTGLYIAIKPFIHIPSETNPLEIKKSIEIAFDSFKVNIPHPKQNEWTHRQKEYLKNMKFKSLRELHLLCSTCGIDEIGDNWIFHPNIKGPGKSFVESDKGDVTISKLSTPEEILFAVNEAFSRCV